MNILILHNSNIPLELFKYPKFQFKGNDYFSETLDYNPRQEIDFDTFLCNKLNDIFGKMLYDVIIIPFSLGEENYTDYSGLRVATHIRLTKEWNHFTAPIVFLGNDDIQDIICYSDLGGMLTTYRVYTSQAWTKEEINNFVNSLNSTKYSVSYDDWLNDSRFKHFLSRTHVKAPANYATHHSATNKWSIFRWSRYIGIENVDGQDEIKNSLYFKYLKSKYPGAENTDQEQLLINEKGRILLVDDEAEKGWHRFFKTMCKGSSYGAIFDSIGNGFKKAVSKEEIISQVEKKIDNYKPDVVLLDLRLRDEDYFVNDPTELTGAKIFDKIKENNRGIQVVIFSASNKIWNYLPFASDGIILKESVEMSMKADYTKECINNTRKILENCLKRRYLKDFYSKIKDIKQFISDSNCFGDRTEELVGRLEIAFDLLKMNCEKNEYNAYAYLQLFLIIEEYTKLPSVMDDTDTDLYLCKESDRYRILKDKKPGSGGNFIYQSAIYFDCGHYSLGQGKYIGRFIDTNFRVSTLLIFKFGENTSGVHNWTNINTIRSTKAAHPESNVVTNDEILQILNFMNYFFDKNKVNWRPQKDAFPERTDEENAVLLQEKFGNVTFKK